MYWPCFPLFCRSTRQNATTVRLSLMLWFCYVLSYRNVKDVISHDTLRARACELPHTRMLDAPYSLSPSAGTKTIILCTGRLTVV